ncbi:E3 ubiquitin-protein ligase CCNB1IP1-like protein [Zea mays]|uniref:E3 ubiquitin-protein ligase CCNB1IP1-like protein n=1 Tax=Zea mays TaxID=4577 RepID=A0A1D6FSU5_MAIZE|nr:E3 ubiquitin-protein ligase CCNB1IP1-like protein [Zea mays]
MNNPLAVYLSFSFSSLKSFFLTCRLNRSAVNLIICRNKMKCNACWRDLEGQAVSTTCGHLLCADDARKILNNDGTCPICDQVLSKSHMKPMDINPGDDWTNMAMVGISPQICILHFH